MADTSVATVGAPRSGSGAEFASQGEDSWDDEFDVGKSAGYSSGSIATGIVRQPAGSGSSGDLAILRIRQEQNESNTVCIQRMHLDERNRAGLSGLSQQDAWDSCGRTRHVIGDGGGHVLPGEHGAGSEHHRIDGGRQSAGPLA